MLTKQGLHPLVIYSDTGGCMYYRVKQPFAELKRFNFNWTGYPYLPREVGRADIDTFLDFIFPYDFVVVQRCFKLSIMGILRQVCDILGKKLVFETDDDYLHIPPHNPCAAEFIQNPQKLGEFVEVLKMADLVTVTTEELKNVYYRFNRNIEVLPNNVEQVHFFKDMGEMPTDNQGGFGPIVQQGFVHIPTYVELPSGARNRMIRIGYTGTVTHREDFKTIQKSWFKMIKKYQDRLLVVYLGDKYFRDLHVETMGSDVNMMHIPASSYDMYYLNIRNLDIGIAPLEINLFNQSKSPIKAIEYGSWGVPGILPNYVTYDREFQSEQNCLMYNSTDEFEEQFARMVDDFELRIKLGNNARLHVMNNRLECLHAQHRFELYKDLVDHSSPTKIFKPKGDLNGPELITEPEAVQAVN